MARIVPLSPACWSAWPRWKPDYGRFKVSDDWQVVPDEVRNDTMNLTWGTDPYATIHVELFIPSSEVFDIWNNVAKQYPHQP